MIMRMSRIKLSCYWSWKRSTGEIRLPSSQMFNDELMGPHLKVVIDTGNSTTSDKYSSEKKKNNVKLEVWLEINPCDSDG